VEAEVQRLDVSMPPALSAWTDRQVHEVAAGRRDEPALSVWAEAATSGEPVVVRAEELDAQGAALASRSGFGACGVAPVPDPTGATAWIVAWFDEPQAALLEFAHWAHEPVGLVHLALERRWHLDRLHEAARRDPLTGLANRTGFFESLDTRLERARRDDSLLAVVFLDLDGFKPVNDVYGHAVGDRVLELVGRRLAGAVRSDDVVARVGGDEFAVVCGLAADAVEQGATELAGRLLATLAEPLTVTRDPGAPGLATPLEPVQLGASVGVAVTSPRAEQPLRVFERADAAMYRAKQAGRGAWVLDTHLVVDEEAGR
jgi:diguanylate cyclase (GGDEF)-like protein